MAARQGSQSCLLIGVGCAISIAVVAVVVGGLMFYGFRKAREVETTMKDPEARRSQALELLAADSLPEGYYAVTAFSIPFLMETVMLSDDEPEGEGDVESALERGDYGLIYTRTRLFGDQKEQFENLFEGGGDPSGLADRIPLRLRSHEPIRFGSADEPGRRLRWGTYRGTLGDHGGRNEAEGLWSAISIDCPDPRGRSRIAIWFGPDPDPEAPAAELDLTGSVGDAERIQALLAGFDVCSR